MAFLGEKARQIRFEGSVENLYEQNDPNKKYDDEIRARFGSSDDIGVIGVVAENDCRACAAASLEDSGRTPF
jgi:hypothetical protein